MLWCGCCRVLLHVCRPLPPIWATWWGNAHYIQLPARARPVPCKPGVQALPSYCQWYRALVSNCFTNFVVLSSKPQFNKLLSNNIYAWDAFVFLKMYVIFLYDWLILVVSIGKPCINMFMSMICRCLTLLHVRLNLCLLKSLTMQTPGKRASGSCIVVFMFGQDTLRYGNFVLY